MKVLDVQGLNVKYHTVKERPSGSGMTGNGTLHDVSFSVEAGEIVGTVAYYLNNEIVDIFPVYAAETVQKIDYWWCLNQILQKWI